MVDKLASEHELSAFLEQENKLNLATWQRSRTSDELSSFIERRFALIDDAV